MPDSPMFSALRELHSAMVSQGGNDWHYVRGVADITITAIDARLSQDAEEQGLSTSAITVHKELLIQSTQLSALTGSKYPQRGDKLYNVQGTTRVDYELIPFDSNQKYWAFNDSTREMIRVRLLQKAVS